MRLFRRVLVLLLLCPSGALAQTYVVQEGDSLSSIAEAHNIAPEVVASANHITDPDHIEVGQTLALSKAEGRVVKRGVVHYVRRGVTLRQIARAYKVSMSRIMRENKIRNPHLLRRGKRIFVPGAKSVVPIATRVVPPCLRPPVEFYRIRYGDSKRVVLTQCNGRFWPRGQKQLSRFLDRTKNHTAPPLNGRLLENLQRVADRFPDRRLEVVSAYRRPIGRTSNESRHAHAKALDFRVRGISNIRLRDFARTLQRVGVGYYPNSTFVHLDVRDRRGFWVDWSGPGEAARYGPLDHDPALGPRPGSQSRRHRAAAAKRPRRNAPRRRAHRRQRPVNGVVAASASTSAAP